MHLKKRFQYIANSLIKRGLTNSLKIALQEIKGDKQYNINTSKFKGTHNSAAHHYQGATYYILHQVFTEWQAKGLPNFFLDIGCGKGRAMYMAARYGVKNIIGIELDKNLCISCIETCNEAKKQYPNSTFKVINTNAVDFSIPETIDAVFMFNPFGEVVMQQVINNLKLSINKKPRKINILYLNPIYHKVFEINNIKCIGTALNGKYIEYRWYEID